MKQKKNQLSLPHCASAKAALLEANVKGSRLRTISLYAIQWHGELGSAPTPHWMSALSRSQRAAGPPIAFQYSPAEKRGTRSRAGEGVGRLNKRIIKVSQCRLYQMKNCSGSYFYLFIHLHFILISSEVLQCRARWTWTGGSAAR